MQLQTTDHIATSLFLATSSGHDVTSSGKLVSHFSEPVLPPMLDAHPSDCLFLFFVHWLYNLFTTCDKVKHPKLHQHGEGSHCTLACQRRSIKLTHEKTETKTIQHKRLATHTHWAGCRKKALLNTRSSQSEGRGRGAFDAPARGVVHNLPGVVQWWRCRHGVPPNQILQ